MSAFDVMKILPVPVGAHEMADSSLTRSSRCAGGSDGALFEKLPQRPERLRPAVREACPSRFAEGLAGAMKESVGQPCAVRRSYGPPPRPTQSKRISGWRGWGMNASGQPGWF